MRENVFPEMKNAGQRKTFHHSIEGNFHAEISREAWFPIEKGNLIALHIYFEWNMPRSIGQVLL